jgi:HAD superfamily hydrolase (TIGR01484 family)
MLNKHIPTERLKRLKLVVFDSDGVLVPRGTVIRETVTDESIHLSITAHILSGALAELLRRLRERFIIVVSSGRSLLYLQTMYGGIVGERTVLQAENGNLSLIEGTVVQHVGYDEVHFATLAAIREEARALPIRGIEPKQFIVSIHADREIKDVYDIVKRHDTRNELTTLWNGEAFDIQRKDVSKAEGLAKLCKHLGITLDETAAIGDRVNDTELLAHTGIGVSADKEAVGSEYWTEGEGLPGELFARYLIEALGL